MTNAEIEKLEEIKSRSSVGLANNADVGELIRMVLKSQAEYKLLRGRFKAKIVCLCGSTRFMEQFHEANRQFSLDGAIVLTVEIVTYDGATDPRKANPAQKEALDKLHLRKIDLADEVHFLNVDGYVGESTSNELKYAVTAGKQITWLEPNNIPEHARTALDAEEQGEK